MTLAVLTRLDDVCRDRGARTAKEARPLAGLVGEVERGMDAVEAELGRVDARGDAPAEKSVRHLLGLRGKRLRPLCVALAARTGPRGFGSAARELAVAAELVHAATLLHDDVVDAGDLRRGAPTARVLYGNAASIFGGDWLLVEAMRRIQTAAVPGALDRALQVLREMLEAESQQLAARGKPWAPEAGRAAYLRVAQGKTASLFAWALGSGGRGGGADEAAATALEDFGTQLGIAFQVVDDALDLADDALSLGKTALADLREGKMTYPLVIAAERDPRVAAWLADAAAQAEPPAALLLEVARAVRATGAVDEARRFAAERTRAAEAALGPLPPSAAREALAGIAGALARRDA